MVYRAQVIDNSQFLTTGKIRVRVAKHYYGHVSDLSITPEKIKEGLYYNQYNELKHTDSDVYVYSPIGGGDDYGMFFMPQVNSEGIVLMLGDASDNSNEFIWLGSIFEMKEGTIKMPSDTMNTANGFENNTFINELLNGALVLKLRSTQLKDATIPEESKNSLNWKKAPIENLIVLNRNKVLVEHSVLDDDGKSIGNSLLTMNEKGTNITYLSEEYNGSLTLDDTGGFTIESSLLKENISNSIKGNSEGIELVSTNGNDTTLITQEADSITLNSGGTAIGIKSDSITLKSTQAVYLEAPNVRLGNDNLKVVLCAADVKTIPLAEGLVLKASDTIFG